MTLAETLAELAKLRTAIKTAQSDAADLDRDAAAIAKKFKQAAHHTQQLQQSLSALGVPDSVGKSFEVINRFSAKAAELRSAHHEDQALLNTKLREEVKLHNSVKGTLQWINRNGGVASAKQTARMNLQRAQLKLLGQDRKLLQQDLDKARADADAFGLPLARLSEGYSAMISRFNEGVRRLTALELLALNSATALLDSYQKFNAELLTANSSLEHQRRLYGEALSVLVQQGGTLEQAAKAQMALASAGLQYSEHNERNLKFVLLARASLGMAEAEAAELTRQAEFLGANLAAVGDSLAWIADRTELTGDKAGKVALEMAKVARNLNLAGQALPAITAAVGSLEGQFTRLGGTEGAVTRLIGHFSTLKGLGDAVVFGGGRGLLDPSAFENVDQLADLVTNTGRQLQQMTGGDPLRLAALEPMLQRMGLTIGDARAIMKMAGDQGEFDKLKARIAESNRLREETGELEKRYTEQLATSGQLLNNLWQRVKALGLSALGPLLDLLNEGLKLAVDATSWLTKTVTYVKTSGDAAAGALRLVGDALAYLTSVIVVGGLIKGITSLARSMLISRTAGDLPGIDLPGANAKLGPTTIQAFGPVIVQPMATAAGAAGQGLATATSATATTAPVSRFSQIVAKHLPTFARFGTALVNVGKLLLRFSGAIGLGIVAGVALWKFFANKTDEENKKGDQDKLRAALADQALQDLYVDKSTANALKGNTEGVAQVFEQMLNHHKQGGLDNRETADIEAFIKANETAMARRVEVQREYVQEHPTDVAALENARQEQERFATLIATLKGELYKVQNATRQGVADQVKVTKSSDLLTRAQELALHRAERASRPAADTYQLNRN